MFIGFNLAFGPMHILGLQGQPRRTYQYPEGMGWDFWNMVSTAGAGIIALSILVFIINVVQDAASRPSGRPQDPWDARTLEWTHPDSRRRSTTSPRSRSSHARDDFWHRKYTEDENGRLVRDPVAAGPTTAEHDRAAGTAGRHGGGHGHGIHMPSPSYFPALASLGLPLVGSAPSTTGGSALSAASSSWPASSAGATSPWPKGTGEGH